MPPRLHLFVKCVAQMGFSGRCEEMYACSLGIDYDPGADIVDMKSVSPGPFAHLFNLSDSRTGRYPVRCSLKGNSNVWNLRMTATTCISYILTYDIDFH